MVDRQTSTRSDDRIGEPGDLLQDHSLLLAKVLLAVQPKEV